MFLWDEPSSLLTKPSWSLNSLAIPSLSPLQASFLLYLTRVPLSPLAKWNVDAMAGMQATILNYKVLHVE